MPQSVAALDRCHSILDLRQLAQRRLPRPVFDYVDGAAETESTARRNTTAFDDKSLIPKCLVDVSNVSTSTRVLGQDLKWPLLCSPTGASRLYHPDGELAVARAAAEFGVYYGVSVAASHSLEEIATVSSGPKLFQLLVFKDRGLTLDLVDRCQAAGYAALCLTVDAVVRGRRERELRSGMGVPPKLTAVSMAHFGMHPRYLYQYLSGRIRKGPLMLPNMVRRAGSETAEATSHQLIQQLDPAATWSDVHKIRERWHGPLAIKGILSAADARKALDGGATAVIVSNHGGRQLDSAATPFDVLPEIVEAVGDRMEVILDGGVRRGVHVVKALALGAKACSVGRPYLFGLAAGGEPGVRRALSILREELVVAMRLSGCTDVQQVDRSIISR